MLAAGIGHAAFTPANDTSLGHKTNFDDHIELELHTRRIHTRLTCGVQQGISGQYLDSGLKQVHLFGKLCCQLGNTRAMYTRPQQVVSGEQLDGMRVNLSDNPNHIVKEAALTGSYLHRTVGCLQPAARWRRN